MSGILRGRLDPEQEQLIQEIFKPFRENGIWPVWAYIDAVMDAQGLMAEDVLASLPVVGGQGGGQMRYGLTRHTDPGWLPALKTPIGLTVAGLWHVRPGTLKDTLERLFIDILCGLVDLQRNIVPSPTEVIEPTATNADLPGWSRDAGRRIEPARSKLIQRKIAVLLEGEPYLWHAFYHNANDPDQWTMKVPVHIRAYRDVTSLAEYIDAVERRVEPPDLPSQPLSAAPLDIPYAVGFVDAVWENRTGHPLFARPDPTSIARLTQLCDSEGSFNSLMSALADVLSQVANPETGVAPRNGALQAFRKHLNQVQPNPTRLNQALGPTAVRRCSDAVETLIKVQTIRHSIEHGDARVKAVAMYADLGLAYPVADWPGTWAQISAITCGALNVLREEVHAGLATS
jgi:hypothetical protein